jgi:hypothetical protein
MKFLGSHNRKLWIAKVRKKVRSKAQAVSPAQPPRCRGRRGRDRQPLVAPRQLRRFRGRRPPYGRIRRTVRTQAQGSRQAPPQAGAGTNLFVPPPRCLCLILRPLSPMAQVSLEAAPCAHPLPPFPPRRQTAPPGWQTLHARWCAGSPARLARQAHPLPPPATSAACRPGNLVARWSRFLLSLRWGFTGYPPTFIISPERGENVGRTWGLTHPLSRRIMQIDVFASRIAGNDPNSGHGGTRKSIDA